MEDGSRPASRFANLIGFKRTLDHIRDQTVFPSGQSMSEIAGLGAAY
jgi:hypothetical protein